MFIKTSTKVHIKRVLYHFLRCKRHFSGALCQLKNITRFSSLGSMKYSITKFVSALCGIAREKFIYSFMQYLGEFEAKFENILEHE
jgi:hypothetical protein